VIVIAGSDQLWWSYDDGASFDPWPLVNAGPVAAWGDLVLVGVPGGLLAGPDHDGLGWLWRGQGVVHLQVSTAGIVGVTDDGDLVAGVPGALTRRVVPAGGRAGVLADDALYAGDDAGRVWRDGGDGWSACGALPEVAPILRLAWADGALLVATEQSAPYVSTDGCRTFSSVTAGAAVSYDPFGGARSVDEAYPVLRAASGRWLVAGWAGISLSDDAGASWFSPDVLAPDYTRGLAFPDPWDGATVFVGANGAGVMRTFDFGVTFDAPAIGLTAPNVQEVVGRPGAPDEVWAIVGHTPWASGDGGRSWAPVVSPFVTTSAVTLGPDDAWLVAFDPGSASGTVAHAGPDGDFVVVDGLIEAFGSSSPVGVGWLDGLGWCATGSATGALVCGPGPEGPWVRLWSSDGPGGVAALAADGVVAVPHHEGIEVSEDGGGSWRSAWSWSGDAPSASAIDADGVWWVGTSGGRLVRSVDGGRSWADAGAQIPAVIQVVRALPDPSAGALLVGTTAGVYRVAGGRSEPVVERWGEVQRVDASSAYVHCVVCLATPLLEWGYASDAASLGWYVRLAEGRGIWATLRGQRLRVLGVSDGSASALVRVDGAPAALISGQRSGVLAEVVVDGDGPHVIEVHGATGAGVFVDALEGAVAAPSPAATAPRDGGPKGGCGGGVGAVAPLGLLFGRRWGRASTVERR
jgi:hypothetical protein